MILSLPPSPLIGGNIHPHVWVVPFASFTDRFWIAFRGGGVLDVSCGASSCTVNRYHSLTRPFAGVSTDPSDHLFVLQFSDPLTDTLFLSKVSPSGITWTQADTFGSSGSPYHLLTDTSGDVFVAYPCPVWQTCIRAYRGTDGSRFWTAHATGGFPVDIEIVGNEIYGISRDDQVGDSTHADIILYAITVGSSSRRWVRVYHYDTANMPSDLVVHGSALKVFGSSNGRPLFGSFRTTDGRGGAWVWTTRRAIPPNVYGGYNQFPGVRSSNDRYLVYNPYDNMFYAGAFALDTTASCSNAYCRPMVIRYNAAGSVYGSWLASSVDALHPVNEHNAALAVDASTGMVYATSMVQNDIWLMQIPPYIPICRKCELDQLQPGDGGAISLSSLNRSRERFVVFDPVGRSLGVFEGKDLSKKLGRGLFWLQPLTHEGRASSRRLRLLIP